MKNMDEFAIVFDFVIISRFIESNWSSFVRMCEIEFDMDEIDVDDLFSRIEKISGQK